MGFASEANIRAAAGMDPTHPTSAVITLWQLYIDAMILKVNPSPDTTIGALIETNRITVLWNNMKKGNRTPTQAEMVFLIEPLTPSEINLIDTNENYGSIPMNGQQSTLSYPRRC